MKPSKKRNDNLGIRVLHDSDPEALETFIPSADSDSDIENEDTTFTGREHYEAVGKSKLREPSKPTLGKEYEGSTVSRAALNRHNNDEEEDPFAHVEEDSDDDPFAKSATDGENSNDSERENERRPEMFMVDGEVAENEDEEIDSDEAFDDEDASNFRSFKFRGSKSRQSAEPKNKTGHQVAVSGSDSEQMDEDRQPGDFDGQGSPEDDSGSGEDVSIEDEDRSSEVEDSDNHSASTSSTVETLGAPAAVSSDRAALKAILVNDTVTVASTISAAADSDAKKGRAIKQQYQSFDRLLDARIKLQKSLTVVKNMTQESFTHAENDPAVQKAEEAALTLWSTIESMRHSLLDALPSSSGPVDNTKKRKRPAPATTRTSTSDLWSRTQSLESQSLPHHRAVLDKWSAKARAGIALPTHRSQLIDRSLQNQNNITTILDTYLAAESDKLIAQASTNPDSTTQTASQPTYDDTPFYQSLLRELIASRSSTAAVSSNASTTAILPSTMTSRLHTPGSKAKHVDTKASKGRKVRYTVHEKLQNFAVEEERGTWEETARREFFGSLFGRRGVLDEDEFDQNAEVGEVEDGEKEALRLFRN